MVKKIEIGIYWCKILSLFKEHFRGSLSLWREEYFYYSTFFNILLVHKYAYIMCSAFQISFEIDQFSSRYKALMQ